MDAPDQERIRLSLSPQAAMSNPIQVAQDALRQAVSSTGHYYRRLRVRIDDPDDPHFDMRFPIERAGVAVEAIPVDRTDVQRVIYMTLAGGQVKRVAELCEVIAAETGDDVENVRRSLYPNGPNPGHLAAMKTRKHVESVAGKGFRLTKAGEEAAEEYL